MSSSLRRLRTERVHADETALSDIKTRLERVRREHATAQALADELAREARELQDMEQYMAARIAEGRAALARECIAALPEDVLRCLFDAAVEDPFTVAAICSRWRRVALAFPALWSNIYVPNPPAPSEGTGTGLCERFLAVQLQRVNILLERSGSSPLEITIPLNGLRCQGNINTHCKQLFDSITSHAARWRVATIGIPHGLGRATLDCLRGPTPLLLKLLIRTHNHDGSFDPPQNGYLPYAPRLRKLALWNLGLGCATSSDFCSLTDLLLIRTSCMDDQIHQYIRRAQNTLSYITLETTVARSPVKLSLPRLQGIRIAHSSSSLASPLLVLPSLTVLSFVPSLHHSRDLLAGLVLCDTLVPFLQAVSATVKSLYLGYPINDDCLSIIAHLKNLQELHSFPNTAAIDFTEAALTRVAGSSPPIWPRLTRISRLGCCAPGVSHEGILQLLAARNTTEGRASFEQSAAPPCKLLQVDLEKGAPEWLVAEITRLLAL